MSAYTPLDDATKQIRLLKLRPESTEDILSFDMTVRHLDNAPPYHAISYVWGNLSEPSRLPDLLNAEAAQIELIEHLERYVDTVEKTVEAYEKFCEWLVETAPMRNFVAHVELHDLFHRPLEYKIVEKGLEVTGARRDRSTGQSTPRPDTSSIRRQIAIQRSELLSIKATIEDTKVLGRSKVFINGTPTNVWSNCRYVLQQAIRHSPYSYIWVDSICINQEDTAEKSKQVAEMAHIYRRASRVLAGLGPADDRSDWLFAMMEALHIIDRALEAGNRLRDQPSETESIWYGILSAVDDTYLPAIVSAFAPLGNRSYFSRLWVIQEVFAGTTGLGSLYFMCGRAIVPRAAIDCTIRLFGSGPGLSMQSAILQKLISERAGGLPNCWQRGITISRTVNMVRVLEARDSLALEDILQTFTGWQCRDPRDRVYALLSMVDWSAIELGPIQPDYSKSTLDVALEMRARVRHREVTGIHEQIFRGVFTGIMFALDITAALKEMQALVRRQHEVGSGVSQHAPCTLRDMIYSWPLYPSYHNDGLVSCAVLTENQNGDLEVQIELRCFPSRDFVEARMTTLLSCSFPFKRLLLNNTLIGVATQYARDGDILIPSWRDPKLNLALILRPSLPSRETFDVIGQALLVFSVDSKKLNPGRNPACFCGRAPGCGHFAARVSFRLSLGDLLAVEGQDMTGHRRYPGEVLAEETIERLGVCPVANRVGSVMVVRDRCLGLVSGIEGYY